MKSASNDEPSLLRIGEVARRTEVTVPTLRYYDELGIVTPQARIGGHRRYSEDVVSRVALVRTAQRIGFSLDEISQLLAGSPSSLENLTINKIESLYQQREELTAMIQLLENFARCGCEVLSDCASASG